MYKPWMIDGYNKLHFCHQTQKESEIYYIYQRYEYAVYGDLSAWSATVWPLKYYNKYTAI